MRAGVLILALIICPGAAVADEAAPATKSSPPLRLAHAVTTATPLRDAIARDRSTIALARAARQDVRGRERAGNWIRRHPACFGAILGFIGGFAIGFLPGDDAVFDDFDASFNGLVIGGVGAAVGAIVGAVSDR